MYSLIHIKRLIPQLWLQPSGSESIHMLRQPPILADNTVVFKLFLLG